MGTDEVDKSVEEKLIGDLCTAVEVNFVQSGIET